MHQPYPTIIPGLRTPFAEVLHIVYFGRMLDKIRLTGEGTLPEAWKEKCGAIVGTFDWRCCQFLKIDYSALEVETLKGRSDEELLQWAFVNGRQPDDQEIEVWNGFMTKRGWRDTVTPVLEKRLAELGLPPDAVNTMFDFIDLDEGRLILDSKL